MVLFIIKILDQLQDPWKEVIKLLSEVQTSVRVHLIKRGNVVQATTTDQLFANSYHLFPKASHLFPEAS